MLSIVFSQQRAGNRLNDSCMAGTRSAAITRISHISCAIVAIDVVASSIIRFLLLLQSNTNGSLHAGNIEMIQFGCEADTRSLSCTKLQRQIRSVHPTVLLCVPETLSNTLADCVPMQFSTQIHGSHFTIYHTTRSTHTLFSFMFFRAIDADSFHT